MFDFYIGVQSDQFSIIIQILDSELLLEILRSFKHKNHKKFREQITQQNQIFKNVNIKKAKILYTIE